MKTGKQLVNELRKQIDALTITVNYSQAISKQKDAKIAELKRQLEDIRGCAVEECPYSKKPLSDMEKFEFMEGI